MRRPNVLLLSESLDSATAELLAAKAGATFSFVDPPPREGWTSRQIGGFLEALPRKAADILLVNCGRGDFREQVSVEEFRNNLRALVARAKAIDASILWAEGPREESGADIYHEAAAEVMETGGVITADFPGFIRNLAETSPGGILPGGDVLRERIAGYFAEALGQWWAVCAQANSSVVRTRLWPGTPPAFRGQGAERINDHGRVEGISEPEITRFLPEVRGRGTGILLFPGGGYGFTGFLRNARELAEILAPMEVPVFGLKYRTGRGAEVPLLDAARAVRWVRSQAAEWGIDPGRIGVAGISAGAHLALNLATNWAEGDPAADDPVEKMSSRPDFVAAFSVWNFGKVESPFVFRERTPPVFLRHTRDDAAFALAEEIVNQLGATKVPHDFRLLDRGGHGAFDFAPGNPGTDWPKDLLAWSDAILRRRAT